MNVRAWMWWGIGGLLVLAGGVVMTLPRGVRNNNPLNIRHVEGQVWRGAIGHDGAFVKFGTPEDGYRAAAVILNKYFHSYALRSVASIIGRWAPSSENDTEDYVRTVERRLAEAGYSAGPWTPGEFVQVTPALMDAMTRVEQGRQPWTLAQIEAGIARA